MALKVKIDGATYAKLAPELQAEYAQVGDSFELSLEGVEDTTALRRSKDNEVQARKTAEAQVRTLTSQIADLNETHTTALAEAGRASAATVDRLSSFARSSLVDNVARTMASAISDSPTLLIPVIKARLQADIDSETPSTKVLGADGKPSKLTIAELQTEIAANPEFRAIIRGSRATGGGQTRTGGEQQQQQQQQQTQVNEEAKLATMKPASLVAEIKARVAAREAQ